MSNPYVPICNNSECFAHETIWTSEELVPPAPRETISRCPACYVPIVWCKVANNSKLYQDAKTKQRAAFYAWCDTEEQPSDEHFQMALLDLEEE